MTPICSHVFSFARSFFFLVVLLVVLGFTQFYFIMSADPDVAPGVAPQNGRPASLASTFAEVFLFNLGVYNPEPVDFEDTRSPRLTYFFYVVFVTINGVVLLNILIAIMGDSFNRVTAHAVRPHPSKARIRIPLP